MGADDSKTLRDRISWNNITLKNFKTVSGAKEVETCLTTDFSTWQGEVFQRH